MGNSRSPSHLPTQVPLAVASTQCPATPLPTRIATVRPLHWHAQNQGPTHHLSMRVKVAAPMVLSWFLLQRKSFLLRYDDSHDRGHFATAPPLHTLPSFPSISSHDLPPPLGRATVSYFSSHFWQGLLVYCFCLAENSVSSFSSLLSVVVCSLH